MTSQFLTYRTATRDIFEDLGELIWATNRLVLVNPLDESILGVYESIEEMENDSVRFDACHPDQLLIPDFVSSKILVGSYLSDWRA